jgi:hypothetical protein
MVIWLFVGLVLASLVGRQQGHAQQLQAQRWEYKVIWFPVDLKRATDQMNAQANDGWEYFESECKNGSLGFLRVTCWDSVFYCL